LEIVVRIKIDVILNENLHPHANNARTQSWRNATAYTDVSGGITHS